MSSLYRCRKGTCYEPHAAVAETLGIDCVEGLIFVRDKTSEITTALLTKESRLECMLLLYDAEEEILANQESESERYYTHILSSISQHNIPLAVLLPGH